MKEMIARALGAARAVASDVAEVYKILASVDAEVLAMTTGCEDSEALVRVARQRGGPTHVRIWRSDRDRLVLLAAEALKLRAALDPPPLDRDRVRPGDVVDYCFGTSRAGHKEWTSAPVVAVWPSGVEVRCPNGTTRDVPWADVQRAGRRGHSHDLGLGCGTATPDAERGSPTAASFPVWIVVSESDDVEGEWVSHCLDLDVVSQGTGARHAYAMGVEATALVIKWDLVESGSLRASKAPPPHFERLREFLEDADQVSADEGFDSGREVVLRVEFRLSEARRGQDPSAKLLEVWSRG